MSIKMALKEVLVKNRVCTGNDEDKVFLDVSGHLYQSQTNAL
jgi:hypothetical protein